jgi:hypothetical protein
VLPLLLPLCPDSKAASKIPPLSFRYPSTEPCFSLSSGRDLFEGAASEASDHDALRRRPFESSPFLMAALRAWIPAHLSCVQPQEEAAGAEQAAPWASANASTGPLQKSVAALLIALTERSLFCPELHLSALLARGLLEAQGAGGEAHRAVLKELNPRLVAALKALRRASESSASEAPGPTRTLYARNRRAALLRGCGRGRRERGGGGWRRG